MIRSSAPFNLQTTAGVSFPSILSLSSPLFQTFFRHFLRLLCFHSPSFSFPSVFYLSSFLPFVACSLLFSFCFCLHLSASLSPDVPSVFVLPLCSIYNQRGGRGTRPAEIKVYSFLMRVCVKKQDSWVEKGRYYR